METPAMRRVAAGFVAALVLALGLASAVDADVVPAVPQRPDQTAFNARVIPGSVLVVAETPSGESTSMPLCTDIPSLKAVWAQEMSGQDMTDPNCAEVPSGSRVQILRKTIAYAVDNPAQPAEPYGNDAHLIVEVKVVSVMSVAPAGAGNAGRLVGRRGYMLVDDLEFPTSK
jgi:hypothetical protein